MSNANSNQSNNNGSIINANKKEPTADWTRFKLNVTESIKDFLTLDLSSMYELPRTVSDIVNLCLRIVHTFLESMTDKNDTIQLRKSIVSILVMAIRNFKEHEWIKSTILQDLTFYEHSYKYIAEVLSSLAEQHDDCTLMTSLLEQFSQHHYGEKEASLAKNVCSCILELANLSPKHLLKNALYLVELLNCEHYSARLSLVEAISSIIKHIGNFENARSMFKVLEERFRDVNAFVRAKVLGCMSDLCCQNAFPISQRESILDLAVSRLMDKSSNVRRKSIQLITDFIHTHPFCIEGGELSIKHFESRHNEVDKLLAKIAASATDLDAEETDELSLNNQSSSSLQSTNNIDTLMVQKKYYSDGIKFIHQIDRAMPMLSALLNSNVIGEVLDTINFLIEADAYKIQSAEPVIKQMMHLVWKGDKNIVQEEGAGVGISSGKTTITSSVFEAYRRIYLEVDDKLPRTEQLKMMANNLQRMIDKASIPELTSFQVIVEAFVRNNWLPDGVFSILLNKKKSRQSMILLTFIGKAKPELMIKNIDLILKSTLSFNVNNNDASVHDPIIMEYVCMSLKCLIMDKKQQENSIPNDFFIFSKLKELIVKICDGPRWFQVLSKAIEVIYLLAQRPDHILSEIIKELSDSVFFDNPNNDSSGTTCSSNQLAVLIFVVGHVALCSAGFLDRLEKRFIEAISTSSSSLSPPSMTTSKKQNKKSELEEISSNVNEDFIDLYHNLRDGELLYGEDSILSIFGPMVLHMCLNSQTEFQDPMIQSIATIALIKFMCSSGPFCEQNLPLLLTILERGQDPITRSNVVIAFGDLMQHFGRIIDHNILFLFKRLGDHDVTVKRNVLLILTHLSLTGLIKVKGQIGEIAKCIMDDDEKVSSLARIFFQELADKDNSIIYNHLADILSILLEDSELPEHDYELIIKFIFEFIKKDKQMESVLEKTCQKMHLLGDVRQVERLAYCFTQITFASDRIVKKFLIDFYPLYRDQLIHEKVYKTVSDILNRIKKNFAAGRGDLRPFLDEFEQKLIDACSDQQHYQQYQQHQGENQKKRQQKQEPLISNEMDEEDQLSSSLRRLSIDRKVIIATNHDDVESGVE